MNRYGNTIDRVEAKFLDEVSRNGQASIDTVLAMQSHSYDIRDLVSVEQKCQHVRASAYGLSPINTTY